ncbi:uncharacterized protein EMH_0028730 [Eimeria mitis]|uniref:Transcription factor TFIIIB component B'' Myb domain-containing protein n=1 Tax=Eimeria mitis TaxID=44415 RepID=U6JNH6_9EIME|nr:uncharacterized protein EMH_0028730 [Eimeria mitis]CDJ27064.1 hypothetical protein EMH_0028730 [Eimeria mitis]
MSGLLGGSCVCASGQQRRVLEEDLSSRGAFALQPYEGAYKKTKGKRWTEEETRKFYDCLSCCGTDLLLIKTMMPGVTDGQLKRKLKIEEKKNAARVEAALATKRSLSLQTYEQLHGSIRRELHCQPFNDSDEEPPPRALGNRVAAAAAPATPSSSSGGLLALLGEETGGDTLGGPEGTEPGGTVSSAAGGEASEPLDSSLMALLGAGPF